MSLRLVSLAALIVSCAATPFTPTNAAPSVPSEIKTIMEKPRYANAKAQWAMVVIDAKTGEVLNELDADHLSFTGSVRKCFSVGMALETIGPDHRFETPVYRTGEVDGAGALAGDLVLVASGDLTFGGRQRADGTLELTDFDHNEAEAFGGAGLTPQDPLTALDDLARQVHASGVKSVSGDVVIDDRLFEGFRVPNGNVFISPMLVNENLIDVTVTPAAQAGQPAIVDWRPKTSAMTVAGDPMTTAAGTPADILLSGETHDEIHLSCLGNPDCKAILSGRADASAPPTIPVGYTTPVVGDARYLGVVRVEDPASYARIAFIEALVRAGVIVTAPVVTKNPAQKLPAAGSYVDASRVAKFVSPRYAEYAKLILKVSLNTGANLSLAHVGLTKGARTLPTMLAAERKLLVENIGLAPESFDFVTNGSGSPDSRATPRAVAKLLATMNARANGPAYRAGFPLLGIEGSVGGFGKTIAGKGHITAKSGATVLKGEMIAMNMAGFIEAKSGRTLAFALFVNGAGPVKALEDTLEVFEDEAQITNILYEKN